MTKPERYDGYYTNELAVQCEQEGYEHRWICQGCLEEGHVQVPAEVAHDCKMVFIVDGEERGQCGCFSAEHGVRASEGE